MKTKRTLAPPPPPSPFEGIKHLRKDMKPSELIRLALHDLKLVEHSTEYTVYMPVWHEPYHRCAVCLAGAVMAMSCKLPRKVNVGTIPMDGFFLDYECDYFHALNSFRHGYVDSALMLFDNVEFPLRRSIPRHVDIANYHIDRKQFKLDMKKLVRILVRHGL